MWRHYKNLPGFVLGFHGCDEETGERLLITPGEHLKSSANEYDWLGPGIYFWEANPGRALDFAQEAVVQPKLTKGTIAKPFVVGAVIDLGRCCNLLSADALQEVKEAHDVLEKSLRGSSGAMPVNRGPDRGARFLDKAVISTMHAVRLRLGLEPYDTVRAAFWEGSALYPEAGFAAKNHIQIAVCNPDCIKGYFRPIPWQQPRPMLRRQRRRVRAPLP